MTEQSRHRHNAPSDAADRLWKTAEVAHYLGMSRKQVWRLWATGKLPGYRLDRCVRFAPTDIEAFLREGYTGTATTVAVNVPPPPPLRSRAPSPYHRI